MFLYFCSEVKFRLGLDLNGTGEIDLHELTDAVNYVAANDTSDDPIFKDPKKLEDFFMAMDTDGETSVLLRTLYCISFDDNFYLQGNGAVDFNEFLAGMTAEGTSGTGGGDAGNVIFAAFLFCFRNSICFTAFEELSH